MWKHTPDLRTRVHQHILRERLLQGGETVVCAVSAGADSTALVLLLHSLRDDLGIDVEIVHVDHCIPEALSAAAAAAAGSLAASLGVPFHLRVHDVPAEARRRKLSLEAAGHEVRRQVFEQLCGRSASHRVATAHSLEDQAETVLMRLARGAGLRGLRGIRPQTPHPLGGRCGIIRPLLHCSRAELRSYAEAWGPQLVEDPTNADTQLVRNRVRHELLPLLQKRFNPRIAHGLAALAARAREDEACLEELASAACARHLKSTPEGVSILRSLAEEHPALRRRAWQQAVHLLGADPTRLPATRLARMDGMLGALPARQMQVLPGLLLEARRSTLLLCCHPPSPQPPAQQELDTTGRWQAFGDKVWIRAFSLPHPSASPPPAPVSPPLETSTATGDLQPNWTAFLDTSCLAPTSRLRLRCRAPGDRWIPPGRQRPHRLKEALQRWGVPATLREQLPILVHHDGEQETIVAVCGWAVSPPYLAQAGATSGLLVEVSGSLCGESHATLPQPESNQRAQRHRRHHLH